MRGVMIGAGYFAAFQAEAWRDLGAAEITAVSDPAPGRARAFAERWGIPRAYTDSVEMLERERPAFADIVTRPEAHLAAAALAAERGVHVICQKPLAPTWQECLELRRRCADARVRLIAHENWRWQPWYRAAAELLRADRIGHPFYVGFRMRTGDGRGPEPYGAQPYFRQMPALLVYETLVHFIDTFRFLAGDIRDVFCRTARLNPAIAGEDMAIVQLGFESGAAGLIDANRLAGPVPSEPTFGTMWIEGERGALRIAPDGRLFIDALDGRPPVEHAFARPERGYRGGSIHAFQQHVVDCLRTGRPAENEIDDYLKTTAATFACYRSSERGRAVTVTELLREEG
jgi:predicted dehydrogenase